MTCLELPRAFDELGKDWTLLLYNMHGLLWMIAQTILFRMLLSGLCCRVKRYTVDAFRFHMDSGDARGVALSATLSKLTQAAIDR